MSNGRDLDRAGTAVPARSYLHKGRRMPRRRSRVLAALALGIPVALLFLPTAMVLVVGMLPTLVAYVVDRDPDKPAPVAVGALNICGVTAYLIDLWTTGHTLAGAARILGDATAWLVMYGAAAIGWVIYTMIPPLVAMWMAGRARARITVLRERQADLVAEWGAEVAGQPGEET